MRALSEKIQLDKLDFPQMVEIGAQDIPFQGQLGELSLAGDAYQAGSLEFLKMMRHSSRAYGLTLAQIAAGQSAIIANLF